MQVVFWKFLPVAYRNVQQQRWMRSQHNMKYICLYIYIYNVYINVFLNREPSIRCGISVVRTYRGCVFQYILVYSYTCELSSTQFVAACGACAIDESIAQAGDRYAVEVHIRQIAANRVCFFTQFGLTLFYKALIVVIVRE